MESATLDGLCRTGNELSALYEGLELLRDWHLDEVFTVGDQNVHLAGLGCDDLRLHRLLIEEHLTAVRLVHGDGGDLSQHLHREHSLTEK